MTSDLVTFVPPGERQPPGRAEADQPAGAEGHHRGNAVQGVSPAGQQAHAQAHHSRKGADDRRRSGSAEVLWDREGWLSREGDD